MSDKITRVPVPPTRSPRLIPREGHWLGDIKAAKVRPGDVVCHERMAREDTAVDDHGKPFIPAWECRVLEATTHGQYRRIKYRALVAPESEPPRIVDLKLSAPVLLVDGPVADPARGEAADERAAIIAGLRQLADLLEQVPELPVPPYGHLHWPLGMRDDRGIPAMQEAARALDEHGVPYVLTDTDWRMAISLHLHGLHVQVNQVRDQAIEEYVQQTSYVPNVQVDAPAGGAR